MIIWIIVILVLLLLNILLNIFKFKDIKKKYIILSSIVIIFFIGSRSVRYPRISDMDIYYNFYKIVSKIPISNILLYKYNNFETGYIIFNKLLTIFFDSPQTIIYIEAIICVISFSIYIYKNSEKPMDSYIFFVAFGLLRFTLTGFRQSIAMSICLLSIEFIKKRKLIPFILMIFLASTFHKTALLFLPSYFLLNNEINLRNIFRYLIFFFVVFIFNNIIVELANTLFRRNYYSGNYESSGIGFIFTFVFVLFLFLLSKKNGYKQVCSKYKIELNLTIISFLLFIFSYFMPSIVQRISWYYYYGLATAIPNLYPKNSKSLLLCRIIFILIGIVLIIHRFSDPVYRNYIFFWQ